MLGPVGHLWGHFMGLCNFNSMHWRVVLLYILSYPILCDLRRMEERRFLLDGLVITTISKRLVCAQIFS